MRIALALALLAASPALAKPQPKPGFEPALPVMEPPRVADGGIFNASAGYAALIEGNRARRVGDPLSILLVESVTTSKSAGSKTHPVDEQTCSGLAGNRGHGEERNTEHGDGRALTHDIDGATHTSGERPPRQRAATHQVRYRPERGPQRGPTRHDDDQEDETDGEVQEGAEDAVPGDVAHLAVDAALNGDDETRSECDRAADSALGTRHTVTIARAQKQPVSGRSAACR